MDIKDKENPRHNQPWALLPIDNVKCECVVRPCDNTTIKQKSSCNWIGCPYDVTGDDGYFD